MEQSPTVESIPESTDWWRSGSLRDVP